MNEKTKADLDAFRYERTKQWTLSDDPETIIEPCEVPCPQCGRMNDQAGALGKTNHFCCRACGWWYT